MHSLHVYDTKLFFLFSPSPHPPLSHKDPPVPVFASKPRFLDADPKDTTEKIPLLPPVRSLHDTFLYIHPVSPPTHTRSHGNSRYAESVYIVQYSRSFRYHIISVADWINSAVY